MAEFMNITSHVLIYPPSMLQSLRIIVIQIHLMFLFIKDEYIRLMSEKKFKYIICYYSKTSHTLNGIRTLKIQQYRQLNSK
uniref:hypothetical protein n=1 Tax=Roseburia hominis TaxID=301301 RepID=UPI001F27DD07